MKRKDGKAKYTVASVASEQVYNAPDGIKQTYQYSRTITPNGTNNDDDSTTED